ncbi:hypothetical protein GOP47_0001855 [Adiantum capillus-veneris]|uniref:Uncharacterized protein n=1 Tax=Adiantum capillus-veneris TaxID=13818 RepID=A0A9D4V9L8_ADICA|nr:hypothetical protein GOP47_0001855 [Adiantum capillus-veneris]
MACEVPHRERNLYSESRHVSTDTLPSAPASHSGIQSLQRSSTRHFSAARSCDNRATLSIMKGGNASASFHSKPSV